MGHYLPLFSVEIEHSFFHDGCCQGIEFVPVPKTAIMIDNAGLLTRKIVNGIQVFYDRNYVDSLCAHVADANESLGLMFKVFSRDNLFINYTEPPVLREDAILYVDSLNFAGGGDSKVRLHQEEHVGDADFEKLGSPLFEDVLSPTDHLVRPLMMVNIRLKADETGLLSEQSSATPKTYLVSFRARETIWKYYLLGEMAKEGLYIVDLDNGIEFEMGGVETLTDNRPALTFRSKTLIPMRERPDCRFQLREKNSGTGKVVIRRLPVASPSQIGRETIRGVESPVSEMFINC